MIWSIMIFSSCEQYYSIPSDEALYDGYKEDMPKHDMDFIAGSKGISSDRIDNIVTGVNGIVSRLNRGERFGVEEEFNSLLRTYAPNKTSPASTS